jgi:hypothetical protein
VVFVPYNSPHHFYSILNYVCSKMLWILFKNSYFVLTFIANNSVIVTTKLLGTIFFTCQLKCFCFCTIKAFRFESSSFCQTFNLSLRSAEFVQYCSKDILLPKLFVSVTIFARLTKIDLLNKLTIVFTIMDGKTIGAGIMDNINEQLASPVF